MLDNKKGRAIADPAFTALKASFVSRHRPVRQAITFVW